jgi:hypothetical protein
MYSITENIYYSQLSSVAILLQPEPNCFTPYNTRKRLFSPSVLSPCGLRLPPTCLLLMVIEDRSYFASTIHALLWGKRRYENIRLSAKAAIPAEVTLPCFGDYSCSPFFRRSMLMPCPSSLRHIIFGVGKPSALQVRVIFWFSRMATDDCVLLASRILGGTAIYTQRSTSCRHVVEIINN